MNVSEAGDKHTYQDIITKCAQMVGHWMHFQAGNHTAPCNPVTQQIRPMAFNPIMGCVYFIQ